MTDRPWKTFDRPDQIDMLGQLDKKELDLLLQLARASFDAERESGSYMVGGIMFEFHSSRELDDLIDDTLAVRTRKGRGTTAA